MNGLFKVNDGFDKLIPIHWEKEKADWLLMRGGYIYEMPFTPPAMYFMNIKPDPDMEYYNQPLNLSPRPADSYSLTEFSSAEKNSGVPHIIFVIHGIGHHESEEGIVENANDIRDGFINYLKKFHPALPTPIIIPIAWRCDLPMDDKQIQASQSLKFEMAKKMGIIANEPLYYLAEYKNDVRFIFRSIITI
uniref:Uncharacterized protein n=1 Tax=Panagrolaimus davidi TaxID=227884 RepID=A0A914QTP3_9BILA